MAIPSRELVNKLKEAAIKLESSHDYQWGHMGSCNCGHLARTITSFSREEIHAYAMRKAGDWSEQVADYCSTSQMPFDLLITEMLKFGIEKEDLMNLERLSNSVVLENLPGKKINLKHNEKGDVVVYIKTWAALLEKQLPPEPLISLVLVEESRIFEEIL